MLVNFKVKNYRSFNEETIFSMQAQPNKERTEINTFFVNDKLLKKGENELLKSAVVFGANASGKSNLVKALRFMKIMVLASANLMSPPINMNEVFAFSSDLNTPSKFEIEIIFGETYYNYGFDILGRQVTREFLNKRDNVRIMKVFSRENNNIEIRSDNLPKEINSQVLYLSFSNNFLEDSKKVVQWFQKLIILDEEEMQNYTNNFNIYAAENNKYKDQALEILKKADIGIDDFRVVGEKIQANGIIPIFSDRPLQISHTPEGDFEIDIETKFNIFDNDKKMIENKTRTVRLLKNYGFHSHGTFRLFSFLGLILKVINDGGVIVCDEIDAQIHFLVVDYILGLFNSIVNNQKNAQFICTLHNVLLMDENLRRDQIYFTMKNKYGESVIYSLSNFNDVRKTDLFSKKYLAGFYSAIPDIGRN